MPIDEGKLEIYKYVQRAYTTLIAARQGQKSRLGYLLLLTGLLITVAYAFAVPALLISMERAISIDGNKRMWAMVIVALPFAVLLHLLWDLTRAASAIVDTLSHVRLSTIGIDECKILTALNTHNLDGNHVIYTLTRNYLCAVRGNDHDNYTVGTRFAVVVRRVRRAIVTTLILFLLTLAGRLALCYLLAEPIARPSNGDTVDAPSESKSNPANLQPPSSSAPQGTFDTPAALPNDPTKPNLDMKPILITVPPHDSSGPQRTQNDYC